MKRNINSLNLLIGKRFGKLVVCKIPAQIPKERSKVVCECDCGGVKLVLVRLLLNGHVKSCGCIAYTSEKRKKHGYCGTRIYRVWQNIKSRCNNKNACGYKYYGGRGIVICDEWEESFINFLNWSNKNGYKDTLELDRKDNNKGYNPGNCRFVTRIENSRNKSSNHLCSYNNLTKPMSEWSEILGVSVGIIKRRLINGIPFNEIVDQFKKDKSF